jgi:hypothetical protein
MAPGRLDAALVHPHAAGSGRRHPLPRSLRAAGWLWLAASLLYLAGWIAAAVIDFPFLAADFAADPVFADAGEEEARTVAVTMLVLALLGVIVVCAGYTVLGFLLWRRQNWARVLLAVAAGIMLVVLMLDVLIGLAWRSGVDGAWRGYAILPALTAAQFGITIARPSLRCSRGRQPLLLRSAGVTSTARAVRRDRLVVVAAGVGVRHVASPAGGRSVLAWVRDAAALSAALRPLIPKPERPRTG